MHSAVAIVRVLLLLDAAAVRGLLISPQLLSPDTQPQRHATALATASKAAATSVSADGASIPPLGFSFTPGGLLFPYYVGAAYELQRRGLLTPNTPLGGSSAGAIVATAVASGLGEADILDGLSVLVADYRGGVSLRVALRKQLLRLLPDDAPQRCERHGLTVCYKRLLPWPKACLTQNWASKQDLIDCVAASCCWPFFFERWPCVWVRGGLGLDGYFALPREQAPPHTPNPNPHPNPNPNISPISPYISLTTSSPCLASSSAHRRSRRSARLSSPRCPRCEAPASTPPLYLPYISPYISPTSPLHLTTALPEVGGRRAARRPAAAGCGHAHPARRRGRGQVRGSRA
jgi:hypothetical protein